MHILIVEDNPFDADLTRRKINEFLPCSIIDIAVNIKRASELLESETKYDIALLDMKLPDGSGMDLLGRIRESKIHLPVIMLTGTGNEEVAAAALKAGADDYMVKHIDYYNQLPEIIDNAVKNYKKNIHKDSEIINVLYIEHHLADIDLTVRHFHDYAPHIRVEVIRTAEKAISVLDPAGENPNRYNVILMDYNLPGLNALDFIKVMRQQLKNNIPIIVVTGMGNEELAVLALKIGATEYITKHDQYIKQLPSLISSSHKNHELIKAKERAEESDRLKTAFLQNISHEIRTPMNAIIGFSELLNDPALLPERRMHFTDVIIQSSKQLLSTITDIISIATIEAGQDKINTGETNVNELCRLTFERFSAFAENKNISLSFETPLCDEDANIRCDETKLLQVLVNLVDNALKFTSSGEVVFGYQINSGFVRFFVRDTGTGIPANMHKEIFKTFRQFEYSKSKLPSGSGLGLSISEVYIEMLGGEIWLTSETGKGSVFYFTVPYNLVPNTDTQNKSVQITDEGRSKTILIAEDEDLNYLLIEEYLSGLDLKITRAYNGSEAVGLCRSDQKIDFILMDIKMPVMNGLEASYKIREIMPDIPIVAQTAYSTETDKKKALAHGCNDFISKPFTKKQLIEIITPYLNQP